MGTGAISGVVITGVVAIGVLPGVGEVVVLDRAGGDRVHADTESVGGAGPENGVLRDHGPGVGVEEDGPAVWEGA